MTFPLRRIQPALPAAAAALSLVTFVFLVSTSRGEQGRPASPSAVEAVDDSRMEGLYVSGDPPFSFRYPSDFDPMTFQDGEYTIILVSGPDGREFQVAVRAFEEAGSVTADAVRTSHPGLILEPPVGEEPWISLSGSAGDGAPHRALIFDAYRPGVGPTREAWLIADGYLYQFTASPDLEPVLADALGTIRTGNN